MTISELRVGKRARIVEFLSNGAFIERLQELGLTPGTEVTVVRRAPFSGPMELAYGHSRLALRAAESGSIVVAPVL